MASHKQSGCLSDYKLSFVGSPVVVECNSFRRLVLDAFWLGHWEVFSLTHSFRQDLNTESIGKAVSQAPGSPHPDGKEKR